MIQRIIIALLITGLIGCDSPTLSNPPTTATQDTDHLPRLAHESAHFSIRSSETEEETEKVAEAVESLLVSYSSIFPIEPTSQKYQVVLYKDQAEFKRNNRSSPWAEAYYRTPRSFAYPGSGQNNYHWMLHEVTHQLLREGSGYEPRRWINEGTAAYFGSSRYSDGHLQLGEPDRNAYPIWWLSAVHRSGESLKFDGMPLFSLNQLIDETGPPIGENVNHYYVAYWSLVHFLLNGDDGKHMPAFQELMARGGGASDFRQLIGSYEQIQPRWQRHLEQLAQSNGP